MHKLAVVLALWAAFCGAVSSAAAQATLKAIQARGHVDVRRQPGPARLLRAQRQGRMVRARRRFLPGAGGGDLQRPCQGRRSLPLSAKDRFTALQSGDIDVLSRNSTWTLSRDTALGLDFPAITFFDGQGFMVRKSLKVIIGAGA